MSYTVRFDPIGIRLVCDEPFTVAEVSRQAGISLCSECGGKAICGKCRVRVMQGLLPEPSEAERQHLTDEEISSGWRLACRTVVSTDSTIYIPEPTLAEGQVVQTAGMELYIEPTPCITSVYIQVAPPSLSDQTADLERITSALLDQHSKTSTRVGLSTLRRLHHTLRESDWQASILLRDQEIITAFPEPDHPIVGLAVDVGTTKIACYLMGLASGQTLAAKGVMNPQIVFGEDVMTRLEKVMVDPASSVLLQQQVVTAINTAAAELCAVQGLSPDDLLDLCLVGNTAMHHLLVNLPVGHLALSPFVPVLSSPLNIEADQLGFRAAPGARAHLPALIAGFVGSDHLAFLLAADFGSDDRIRIGIDIGTNTEIALQANGRILSCSTASGPAFEGAHIQHGMRASPGAIERVKISEDGSLYCDVIGGGPAIGICGSGVLDALAEMRNAGILNPRGRFHTDSPRILSDEEGSPTYLLVAGDNGRRNVTLSQNDVNQILLAKGAIRAGIDILMDHLGVDTHDIEEILIAGAFGSYLDPGNAVRIGMLPEVPLSIVQAVGNAAGVGARIMLASAEARKRASGLARRVEYLELTVVPGFNQYFARGVRLPEIPSDASL